MHALRSLARAAAPCLLVPVLASAPQEVEYDCGAFDVIHTAGRINTFVFDAHAQQQGTTSDDIYLHAAQLEARFADFVSCPTEECASTYPEWDCTKYAHLDMNSGSHFTFYDEGLVGTYVIFVNTTVQRGCVPCFE